MSIRAETLKVTRELRVAVLAAVDDETRALTRAWARAWDQVSRQFAAAADEVAAAAALGRPPTIGQVRRLTRARNAVSAAQRQIDKLLATQARRIPSVVADVVDVTARANARAIATQLPRTEGTTAQLAKIFDRVSDDALDAIVQRTTKRITSQRLPLSRSANEQMLRALVRAIPEGQSPRTAAQQMVDAVQGRFNGGLARALTVSRTEILDAYRTAAMVQQKRSADVLAGWVWTAQLDSKTCPSCVAEHGTEHDLTEFGPDDHQNGRCARTPLVKPWSELGFTSVPEPDSDMVTGPEWFAAQPEGTQLAIVGQQRLDALQSGRIGWDDMAKTRSVRGWRDSTVPATLADLDLDEG